jgi:hypothetical protein
MTTAIALLVALEIIIATIGGVLIGSALALRFLVEMIHPDDDTKTDP